MKARLSAKFLFHLYANKINFHMKSVALSLAFIIKFTATRKWPICRPRGVNLIPRVSPLHVPRSEVRVECSPSIGLFGPSPLALGRPNTQVRRSEVVSRWFGGGEEQIN